MSNTTGGLTPESSTARPGANVTIAVGNKARKLRIQLEGQRGYTTVTVANGKAIVTVPPGTPGGTVITIYTNTDPVASTTITVVTQD